MSAKSAANQKSFTNYMTPSSKERFPESKYAVRVLELAREREYLGRLAEWGAAWRWQDKVVACPCCRTLVRVSRPPPRPRTPRM